MVLIKKAMNLVHTKYTLLLSTLSLLHDMGRLLLTQSQVTVLLSSALIALFTLLLFLSGYVHQQRNLVGIQTALKPKLPKPPPTLAAFSDTRSPQAVINPSRILGSKIREGGHVATTNFRASVGDAVTADWTRLAHVQVVRRHHDMCNAIMVLAELHRLKSPARRVLLFPQAWAAEKLKKAGKGEISDPTLDISRRLMKAAARRYGVELRPIMPIRRSEEGGLEDGPMDTYSLASAFALTDLDRVLSIETPGLVVDAEPLDAVLAFTEPAQFAVLHDTSKGDGVHGDDLYLLQPSMEVYLALRQTLAEQDSFNDTALSQAFGDPLLLESESTNDHLVRSIGVLHNPPAADPISVDAPHFNATAFLTGVSYIRFSDPKLPGPEYEVPWSSKVAARPKNKDADWTWTKLYGQFEQKRMEVCGLGLETWRP